MPSEVQDLKDKEVEYEDFCKLQPQWDIYSTVKSLKEVINNIKKVNSSNLIFGI